MTGTLRIRWVNHAGFMIEGAGAVILCDPWLEGAVFNNGWELLVPTPFEAFDFSTVTHIWFSHEHPDHFSPASLRKILPLMPNAQVLFQETADKRLVGYFAKQGRTVREMKSAAREEIAPGIHMTVGKNGIEDSWALFELAGRRVLNLNDCIFSSKREIDRLARELGSVDLLLSQFSYAEKIGNTGDAQLRHKAASHFLGLLAYQVRAFAPAFTIPFASFKYFSHRENFYMNEGMATASQAVETLASVPSTKAISLFPGDVWEFGAGHDNAAATAKYTAHEKAIQPRPYADKPAPAAEIAALSGEFVKKLAAVNKSALLFALLRRLPFPLGLPRLSVWVEDLNGSFVIHPDRSFEAVQAAKDACDIVTTTPNLTYAYQHFSGFNALMVNGRYQSTPRGNLKLFIFSHLALMASADVALSFGYVLRNMLRILAQGVGRLLQG